VDWNSLAKLARESFRDAINDWIGKAQVRGGMVMGPNASLTPGSLSSPAPIEPMILQKLLPARVPPEVAVALARELAAAWNAWAAGFQAQLPGVYPQLAAVPGPVAPPTPAAAPIALTQGSSAGEFALKAPVLAAKLTTALRGFAAKIQGGSLDQAMKGLAEWVDASFQEWKGAVRMIGVYGRGPAPNFAPPYVPIAPVVGGDNMSAGPLFVGPPFGKAVF
jgi:hypothetical protein